MTCGDNVHRDRQDPRVRPGNGFHSFEYDARSLLSLAQDYVFHGPPPHAGDTLETELRFDRIEEKQSRRGPMIMVLFTVLFHRADGTTAAECHHTSAYFAADPDEP